MTNTRKDDVCVCDLCLVGTQVRSVAHGKKLKNSGHFLGRALGGWGGRNTGDDGENKRAMCLGDSIAPYCS